MKTSERILILGKGFGGFLLVFAGLMWAIHLPAYATFGVILGAIGGATLWDEVAKAEKRNK